MQFKNFNFPNSALARDLRSFARSKWMPVAMGSSAVIIGLAVLASSETAPGLTPNSQSGTDSQWCYDQMNQKLVIKPVALHCDKSAEIPSPISEAVSFKRPVLLQSMVQF
ncbi:hypothetical protein [Dyadobacter crusticola]|uniref:hypothetical protein n=1 Tax=Dyadobacter crusticola TaxID=292407 RepID=UPI0004E2226C|nr:hypothetical protein [Dyadobacter crusticola]